MNEPEGSPPLVLFDLDGTLLSLPVKIEEVRRDLSEYFALAGVEMTFRPVFPMIERAVRLVDDVAERGAAYDIIRRAEDAAASDAVALPGAARALAGQATRFGIVTNNAASCVAPALAAAGLPSVPRERVWGRIASRPPKPDPAALLLALGALGPAESVWYVGDRHSDAVAAARADAVSPAVWRSALVGDGWKRDGVASGISAHVIAGTVLQAVERIAEFHKGV